MITFLTWQLTSKFMQFLFCSPVSLTEQGINSGVGSGFVVAVLGFCHFFCETVSFVNGFQKVAQKDNFWTGRC